MRKLTLQSTESISDGEIVELYWQRDERSIRLTEQKYGRYLFSIAHNILNDSSDSEECVNDTYLGAWNSIPPERPVSLIAYLSRIVRNGAVSRYRKKTSQKRGKGEFDVSISELSDVLSDGTTPQEESERGVLAGIINTFVHTLDEDDQFIFVSRYYFSYPVQKIAERAGVAEGKIYKRLASLRARLKEKIEEEGFTV